MEDGFFFNSYYYNKVQQWAYSFPRIIPLTFKLYLIMQGGIKYPFLRYQVPLFESLVQLDQGLLGHWRTLTIIPMGWSLRNKSNFDNGVDMLLNK